MKQNIGVIYTGGTFGMIESPTGLVPAADMEVRLRQILSNHSSAELPSWRLYPLDPLIDSANADFSSWLAIEAAVRAHSDVHQGWVIIHGTDTMAYSASALSFLLADLAVPVVFTGAQVPLEAASSDAPDNFRNALVLAADKINGVWISFGGEILQGNRATKVHTSDRNAFAMPNGLGAPVTHTALLRQGAEKSPRILIASIAPGVDAKALHASIKTKPDMLILRLYGAGTFPNDAPALVRCLAQAAETGIVMIAVSQCEQGNIDFETYAVSNTLRHYGVISAGDMTLEAVYAKATCLYLRGYSPDKVRMEMVENLCGELA